MNDDLITLSDGTTMPKAEAIENLIFNLLGVVLLIGTIALLIATS